MRSCCTTLTFDCESQLCRTSPWSIKLLLLTSTAFNLSFILSYTFPTAVKLLPAVAAPLRRSPAPLQISTNFNPFKSGHNLSQLASTLTLYHSLLYSCDATVSHVCYDTDKGVNHTFRRLVNSLQIQTPPLDSLSNFGCERWRDWSCAHRKLHGITPVNHGASTGWGNDKVGLQTACQGNRDQKIHRR